MGKLASGESDEPEIASPQCRNVHNDLGRRTPKAVAYGTGSFPWKAR